MAARSRSSRSLAAAVLTVVILGGPSASGAAALGPGPVDGAFGRRARRRDHAPPNQVLREPLWRLASAHLSTTQRRQLMAGLVIDARMPGPAIAVSVELAAPATPEVAGVLGADGASRRERRRAHRRGVRVAGPAHDARRVAGGPAIRPIRPVTASGDAGCRGRPPGSSAWQAAGLTGDGVKVGIIDGGFGGIAALLGSLCLPRSMPGATRRLGSFTSKLADCDDGETHGTAVAEAVFDMAPGIDLYVADPISSLDEQRTVTWMTRNGIGIIKRLVLLRADVRRAGRRDVAVLQLALCAGGPGRGRGALWVNAAGNAGDSGWTGPWTDADANGWLDFAPGVDVNGMTLAAGEDVDGGDSLGRPVGRVGEQLRPRALQGEDRRRLVARRAGGHGRPVRDHRIHGRLRRPI